MQLRFLAVVVVTTIGLAAPSAAAVPKPQPLAPGPTVAKGTPPSFKARLAAKPAGVFAVFVIVSRSKETRNGVLKNPVYLEKMAPGKGRTFRATPEDFTFNKKYWLNEGGTFWWQAYLVKCEVGSDNCYHASAPRKLVVR